MKDWSAFIFDFDGVLTDSVEVKALAFAKLFEDYGQDIVQRVIAHHRANGGINRFDKFRLYYNEYLGKPISDTEIILLSEKFSRLVVDEIIAAPEIKGVTHFLNEYSDIIKCFVNSATPQNEIREIVERRGWSGYLKKVLGAPASKKDNLKYILNSYGLVPEKCLFFGDAVSDYEAARVCGVPFLGIVDNAEAPLLVSIPDILWVRNFQEVKKWLES